MKKIYAIILSFGLIIAPVQHAKAEEAEMSWGGVTNMVLGLSTGLLGSTVLLRCKLGGAQPSLWAYMVGSLAYITSELIGAQAHKAHINAIAVDLEEAKKKLQEGDSIQRLSLELQLNTQKENLAFVQKRKGWMYAVGVLYTLATTFAIMEAVAEAATLGVKNSFAGCIHKDLTWRPLRALLFMAFMPTSALSSGIQNGWVQGGIVLGSSLMFFKSVSDFMDKGLGPLIDHGIPRSITFGSFTLVSAATIIDLEITQGTIEKNIEDITKVLINQYEQNKKDGVITGPGAERVASGLSRNNSIKKLDGYYALSSAPCVSNSGGSISINSSNCKKPMKITRPNLSGSFSNNTLQSATAIGADYVNALAAGDMAKAEVLGGQLSNMAGRLKIIRDDAIKKYNQVAKEKNKKILDFDKEVKAFNESMSGNLSKSLASQGIDPQKLNKASSNSVNKPVASISAQPTPEVAAPEVPIENLASTPETPAEEVAQTPAPTLEESLENFESSESDISPEKQVSIFKQVSNRYILNYNRFFREEEPNPEATPGDGKAPVPQSPLTQPIK